MIKDDLTCEWVLVTGGHGFIGSHIYLLLRKRGYKVIHIIRLTANSERCSNDENNIYCHVNELSSVFSKVKIVAVFHLATKYGRNGQVFDVFQSNVNLPLTILQLCVEYNCNIFISADTFFGKKLFNYEYMRLYTSSKASLVDWAKTWCKQYSHIKFVNLRLEHVYGPGDSMPKFVPDLIWKLKMNQKEIPMTSGCQIRDFIYVDDISSLYLALLSRRNLIPTGFSEYEVGTGVGTSVRQFADLARELIGSESTLVYGAIESRNNEILESIAITEPLRRFGWTPLVPLPEGLVKTIM